MQDTTIYINTTSDSTVFGEASTVYNRTSETSLLLSPIPDRNEQYIKDAVAVGTIIIYLLVILFAVKRYVSGMYMTVVSYRFALKQREEGSSHLPKSPESLILFTILIFTLYFSIQMKMEENWRKIILFAVFFAIFSLQNLVIKLTGAISKAENLFGEIIFNRKYFLSTIGILVFPTTLLALLYENRLQTYFLSASLILLATVLLLMQIRLLNIFAKAGVSYFLCFLYLCALEISPYLLLLIVF